MMYFEIPLYTGIGIGIISLIVFMFFVDRLRRDHPDVYDALGRPSVLDLDRGLSRWRKELRFMKFVLLREHVVFGDRTLSRLSDSLLFLFLIQLVWAFWFFLVLARER